MFTGLITAKAKIISHIENNGTYELTLLYKPQDITIGESIAVDGVCLTVNSFDDNTTTFLLSTETTRLTNFNTNHIVNIERAMRVSDRLGGHFVTGHIDQIATVESCTLENGYISLKITNIDEDKLCYLSPKCSIAINGISLTVNSITNNSISLMIIPKTIHSTNIKNLKKNDKVHVEFCLIAKNIHSQVTYYLSNNMSVH